MDVSRRFFFFGSFASAALAQRRSDKPARPNILLILADDVGAWMLGCYGNQEIRTPNIDVLAATGTRFLQNFVATPGPSPSRLTLLTGRTPGQHGVEDAPSSGLTQEVMLSDLLAGGGYHCGYLGKWDLGDAGKPQHAFTEWHTDPAADAAALTARAGEFLGKQVPERPFFLTVAYPPGSVAAGKYTDLYAKTSFDAIGWEPAAENASAGKEQLKDAVASLRQAAAALTALDDQLPALLNKLKERRLFDNTLVIFTGVNGSLLGRHGLWGDGAASQPVNMYEEVIRTPLIWAWPGKMPVQHTPPELVSAYDLLPTLCDTVDLPLPQRNLSGRSYLALATGRSLSKKEPWKNYVFGQYRDTDLARDARYKLVLRKGGAGPNELFDLRADAREKINQFENPAFVNTRERLGKELAAWKARTAKS